MERTHLKKTINKAVQIVFPLLLGAAILVWTYHGFDFRQVWEVMDGEMNYWWMAFSLVFGVLGHVFRGWRWNLTLAPLGEYPKLSDSVYAVFISYAANLVLPRVGEVSRCGVLARYDGVSFSKSLGTVVTERLIDTLCVLSITAFTLLVQSRVFAAFFDRTGTNAHFFTHLFTSTNFYITLVCIAAVGVLAYFLFRNLSVFARVKGILGDIWAGCGSLRHVHRAVLFVV